MKPKHSVNPKLIKLFSSCFAPPQLGHPTQSVPTVVLWDLDLPAR